MKIFVSVKPNSKRQGVEKVDNTHFVVPANAPKSDPPISANGWMEK